MRVTPSSPPLGIPRRAWRLAFLGCLMAVLVLSLVPPGPDMPTTGWDKTNHLFGFVVLTLLGCWSYPGRYRAVLPALLAFGGLIECLQSLTPYRSAEWGDLLADGIGILLGWLLLALSVAWNRRSGAHAPPPPQGPRR